MSKHARNQFTTVMRFEFMTYMHNKVYVGITIGLAILLAVGLSVPTIIQTFKNLGLSGPDVIHKPTVEETLYIVDQTGRFNDLTILEKALPGELWQTASAQDLDRLKTMVEDSKAGGILLISQQDSYTWIIRRSGMTSQSESIRMAVANYFRSQNLIEHGLDQTAINSILSEPKMQVEETVQQSGKSMDQTYFYTYLLLFLLYMTVMMYGQLVATSVASEKSNRATELLITSARPINLMFGKVIGSGLAGLTQIAVLLLTAAASYWINANSWHSIDFVRSIFQMPPMIVVYTILFYLTGYFAYAFLYGAFGSLASRTEDINTSIMPIVMLFMVAFFASITGMMMPDAGWLVVCSFIPFISPLAMFVRICMTDVPTWQIALSLAIMLATIWGTGWISARIYRIGMLMYGKPPKLKELARMLRNAR